MSVILIIQNKICNLKTLPTKTIIHISISSYCYILCIITGTFSDQSKSIKENSSTSTTTNTFTLFIGFIIQLSGKIKIVFILRYVVYYQYTYIHNILIDIYILLIFVHHKLTLIIMTFIVMYKPAVVGPYRLARVAPATTAWTCARIGQP